MFNNFPDMMTVKEAAEALRISVKTIRKLANNHQIGCKRIGRKILIPKCCLIQYVRSAQFKVHL